MTHICAAAIQKAAFFYTKKLPSEEKQREPVNYEKICCVLGSKSNTHTMSHNFIQCR